MGKRYFRISVYGGGGEIVVGQATKDLVENFQGEYAEDVIEAIEKEWHDTDDIEHVYGPSPDASFSVVEIDAAGEEINEAEDFNLGSGLYSREAGLFAETIPDFVEAKDQDKWVPVMSMFSIEKGQWFEAIVETDGEDFDADLVHPGYNEFNFGQLVEQLWYDRTLLELDFDNASADNKAMEVSLGYMNLEYHEKYENYQDGSEIIEEAYEYI
ncbi:MAG: hypothetical protein DRQ35_01755 [Gammaproteobacteria bacterium]|nr:MAG: hypothetical protein DRQ35_01755 [Gammaproteobacteria bacterium]